MAQSHILFEIRRRGSSSMQRVAEELGMNANTFSRQAKNLESKGLIVRRVSMTPFEREAVVRSLRLLNEALTKPGCCTRQDKNIAWCN